MAERLTKGLIALAVVAGVLSAGFALLYFLQTRDVTGSLALFVGLGSLFGILAVLAWVREDAPRVGVPRIPWMGAIVLAPGLGFVAYLVARQLAGPRPDVDP